jgi:hypothetical protein
MSKKLFARLALVLFLFSFLTALFQNCSKVQFVTSNAEDLSSLSSPLCEPQKIEINGTCQTPAVCRVPLALNRLTNTCVCNAPNLQINGICQTPKTCIAPAVINFLTNSCVCNAPNTLVNGTCKAPTESCAAPAVKNSTTGACLCEAPNLLVSGVCQPPTTCTAPSVLTPATNTCACNAPHLLINGVCKRPVTCQSPTVLNSLNNTCICNAPNIVINGVCTPPAACTSPSVLNPATNTCVCNAPNIMVNGVCTPPAACTSPSVLNPATNTCVCNAPNIMVNGVCTPPNACTAPSVLNPATNTCVCNAPNIMVGGICKAPPQCTQEEVLKSTRSYFKSFTVSVTDIANNCVDAAVPNPSDNMFSISVPESIPRFFNTCGNRYCNTKVGAGYIEGRVVEYHGTTAELECRKKDPPPEISDSCKQKLLTLPSPIEFKSATDTEIATSCLDSNNPTISQNLPASESNPELRGQKINRWNFICATRWCKAQNSQFTSGRVTESFGGANSLNCYREEIFNSLEVGTISTTIKTTLDDVAANCIDASNPTLASNYPTTTFQHLRLINTCGRRYCMNRAAAKSGFVINMNGTTGASELTLICIK